MRLALVHGFTQSGASWAPIVPALHAGGDMVVTPDLPGHGARSGILADLPESATLLAAAEGPAVWIGYSLGGRVALQLALDHPDVVQGLVLVSATAGIDDRAERASRQRADETLAARIERMSVDEFLDEWLAAPMWATLEDPGRDARRCNTSAGLAASLRLAGQGAQAPLWDRLGEIGAPTLIITGALDTKFEALGDRLSAAIPGAARVRVPGAGHAVPWERPEEFVDAISQRPIRA